MPKDEKTRRWIEKVGNRLRERRKALGLSLEDLSRLSGSTLPTLSNIERGKRDVKLSTLVSVASALRLELPTLFADDASSSEISSPGKHTCGYPLDDD